METEVHVHREGQARLHRIDEDAAAVRVARVVDGVDTDEDIVRVKDLGEPEAAIPLAERARELASGNAQVLDTLGVAYYEAGRIKDARAVLEQSVALQELAPNLLHLGQVYLDLQLLEQAEQMLRQAIEIAERTQDADVIEQARPLLASLE